jgi:hypothetical protein
MDGRDLERFFVETQMEFLRESTDTELLGELEDLVETEEFNTMLSDLA